jgi:hypothetical protein
MKGFQVKGSVRKKLGDSGPDAADGDGGEVGEIISKSKMPRALFVRILFLWGPRVLMGKT